MNKHILLTILLLFASKTLFSQCLSGQYTHGQQGDFENFDSLQNALNNFGVCGPTRILLLPGRHVGGLVLSQGMGIDLTKNLEIAPFDGQKGAVIWQKGRFEVNLIKTGGSARLFDFAASWFINVFDHNNYDLGAEGVIPIYQSLASWQNLTGLDLHTTNLPIKFETENDLSGLSVDLHLAADSPNKPLTIPLFDAVTTDIDGQNRSLTEPAIGADEPGNLPLAGAVWPGDCDAEKQVSTQDWLQLGVAVGQNLVGPTRNDLSISWSPKYAPDWPDSIQQVNGKHADCNGDGTVSVLDTVEIVQNFGEAHFLTEPSVDRSGINLTIELPAGPYFPGQQIAAPVLLGESPEDFYGLAFGVSFSENAITPGSFWVDFQSSWLGQNGVNLMGFYKKYAHWGRFPVAMVKTDGVAANGFGQVAVLHFKVGTPADSLKLTLIDCSGILSDGTEKSIAPAQIQSVSITLSQKQAMEDIGLHLWPNPSDGRLFLDIPGNTELLEIDIFDTLGRLIFSQKTSSERVNINIQNFPQGISVSRFWAKQERLRGPFC